MAWLITGGAGYIGAHVVRSLIAAGASVVVVDDLSTGRVARVPAGVPFEVGSVADADLLVKVLRRYDVSGVLHLAAKKQIAESVADPLLYYRENVGGCEALLRAMTATGVRRLVLSSSAAVYGLPGAELVTEDEPTVPLNAYGHTKLICEQMVRDVGVATGLTWVSLRYFNVAGAGEPELADPGAANLIPMVFQALSVERRPEIFGDDYPTPDGTCVRDFVHVVDVAEAHVAAARALLQGPIRATYNVGRGEGASVREVLATVAAVTGRAVEWCVRERRPGDPARVVADPSRIEAELCWRPRHTLREVVESAWAGWPAGRKGDALAWA